MSGGPAVELLEILGLGLFESHRAELAIVERFREQFKSTLGWHYYLDLAWIIRRATQAFPPGSLLLDAGAGCGLLQFILAESGYNVISADFTDRDLPPAYAQRYGRTTHHLNRGARVCDNAYTKHLGRATAPKSGRGLSRLLGPLRRAVPVMDPVALIGKERLAPAGARPPALGGDPQERVGSIFLYTCDLKNMALLPDGLVDGVVSLSALEHNEPEDAELCVAEILRVTKPAAPLFMTVSASVSADWYHVPSKGWCYSETTLRRLFGLSDCVVSNFSRKTELFDELRKEHNELHQRLDPVYFTSGANGMPWGRWDPRYLPVGVVKIKHAAPSARRGTVGSELRR